MLVNAMRYTRAKIESAIRVGNSSLASRLVSERMVHKPLTPLSQRFASKLVA
ncbi:MAG: hypothetical protein ACYST9_06690 [Planctomycetota bacterium]